MYDKLIFESSKQGRIGYHLPKQEIDGYALPENLQRKTSLDMPEVTELEVVRHFTNLSMKNFGIDQGFYPLGSCTMKYNPKINEELACHDGFTQLHPLQPASTVQGALEIYDTLSTWLSSLTGFAKFNFNGFAGAHGELAGLMIIKAYHLKRGDTKRNKMLIPVTAHGTNPASASLCGMETVEVNSNERGCVDLDHLKSLLNDEVAGIMLTNPNTLGLFEEDIIEISRLIHDNGGLLYYDGANLNALLGCIRPADMGFDVIHLNLHKTFSTPHGGGGPGSGPIGVRSDLIDYLPNPQVVKREGKFALYDNPKSIGAISGFYGNFLVVLKAYFYVLGLGKENIRDVAKLSVLNANYVKKALEDTLVLPIETHCMHEVVFDGLINKKATTLELAKRLLDYGYHPPTIYFPLVFHQSIMIEPTECESLETLDAFIASIKAIAQEADTNVELLKQAPLTTPVRRLDEVKAARVPILKFKDIV